MRVDYVDVFGLVPFSGNPVAVVHDSGSLSDGEMLAIARWTNLSETAFLTTPTSAGADYALRIFTTEGELPFAGHPTLGAAHAWVGSNDAASTNRQRLVQECAAGLIELRRDAHLAFHAPPLQRGGPLTPDELADVASALVLEVDAMVDAAWCDNGPGWIGVLLNSADDVLALQPTVASLGNVCVGVAGPHAPADAESLGAQVEVRTFYPTYGTIGEDVATGSFNAALAQWLVPLGRLPQRFTARQGTRLGRDARLHVEAVGADVWVGGATRTLVSGELTVD